MKNYVSTDDRGSIYPGSYVLLFYTENVVKELEYYPQADEEPLRIGIQDLADCCIIEAEVPRMQRENFFLYTDENVLSVCILHNDSKIIDGINFRLYKHKCSCKLPLYGNTL